MFPFSLYTLSGFCCCYCFVLFCWFLLTSLYRPSDVILNSSSTRATWLVGNHLKFFQRITLFFHCFFETILNVQKIYMNGTKNFFTQPCKNKLRIYLSPHPILQCIFPANKDIFLYNHNKTIKTRKRTLIHSYHLNFRPHSSFTSFPMMPFIAKGSSPESCYI